MSMGMYRVTVEAVGGHGCDRDKKDGEEVYGCGQRNCPDCTARAFVEELQRSGSSVEKATLEHWPGQDDAVTDDLLTKKRSGSF